MNYFFDLYLAIHQTLFPQRFDLTAIFQDPVFPGDRHRHVDHPAPISPGAACTSAPARRQRTKAYRLERGMGSAASWRDCCAACLVVACGEGYFFGKGEWP